MIIYFQNFIEKFHILGTINFNENLRNIKCINGARALYRI